jgi:hypothetical protein
MGALGAVTYAPSEWQATFGLLMVSQAFFGVVTWHRFRLTKDAVLPDFLTMYSFAQFIAKSLTGLGVAAQHLSDPTTQFADYVIGASVAPLAYQFRAELVFMLASACFFGAWILLERNRPAALWYEPSTTSLWWFFGISTIAYFLLLRSPWRIASGMTLESLRLFAIGAVAVLVAGKSAFGLGRPMVWVPTIALAPFMAEALATGMKGEILIVAMPLLLPMFRRLTLPRVVVLGAFLAGVLLFVFPFSLQWRLANWGGYGAMEGAGIGTVAERVANLWDKNGILDTAVESTAMLLSRTSSAEAGGLVMRLAESDGFIGSVTLTGLDTLFVPRFLWSEKPKFSTGGWFTWYLGRADSPEKATSATAMMLGTELYWMYGVAGVVIGMLALSLLYFKVWSYMARRSAHSLVAMGGAFALLIRSWGLESLPVIGALSFPIILTVYVMALNIVEKWLARAVVLRTERGTGF